VIATIIDAATQLLATRGYEATTMQDVAAKVGMTAPALYYYFDSKQLLLYEVIEINMERFAANVDSILAATHASPTAGLRAFVRTHLEFQLDHVEGARIYNAMFLGTGALLDALTPRQRAEIRRLQTRIRDRLKAILRRGVVRKEFVVADLMVTAMGILAMGEFAAAWFEPGGPLTGSQVAEQYAELAVRMVRLGR
jgi:AcrR family transcriptional regulator